MLWNLLKQFRQLEREQWLSRAELSQLQDQRLRGLIRHAYQQVPYYRRLFDEHGLHPGDIATVGDLPRVPLLTKAALQRGGPGDFMACGIDRNHCVKRDTSGTSGRHVILYRTKHEDGYGSLTVFRSLFDNGSRPWERQAYIQGRDPILRGETWLDRVRRLRRMHIWTGLDIQDQIRILRPYRPQMIMGFNQSLKLLAHAVRQSGIRDISPRLVFGCAECLDEPSRALINEVFGVRMCDRYGSAEASCIAWECSRHSGYHLNVDTHVVEFIRDGRPAEPGERGHVVVTPLFLRAMPLIRYDLEDIGTPADEPCPCGRGLPLMQLIQGRADSFVVLPSGRIVPPAGTFSSIIDKESAVLEFLVVQEDYDLIVVRLVAAERAGPEVAERVQRRIEELVEHEAVVRVEIVDRIDRAPDAKLHRVISRVPVNF